MKPTRIGRYSITKELGKGSMGVVYEGQPDDGGPAVAVKVFFPDTKLSPQELSVLRERFQREGKELQRLAHRNVVHVFEAGEEQGLEYIVMEKLQGFNLKELLELGTRFTLAETLDVMRQLLAGLSACHLAGVVHRDIKPANVFRLPDGVIKLTDFGIARLVTDATLARAGTVVGTPNYMSPQQIKGEDVDARSDIFSAGILLYELLTAKKPFDGPDITAIMYNVATVQPPSLRFYNSALPPELDGVVFKALAKDAGQRFSSAEEFSAALSGLEDRLRYVEGSEAFLNAMPSAPDPSLVAAAAVASAAGSPSSASAGALPVQRAAAGSGSAGTQLPPMGVKQDQVYCVDCGFENPEVFEFCQRCMRPLLKRSTVTQLASQQARMMGRTQRGDYLFLSCLSVVIVATVLFILYLFFRHTI